MICPHCKQKIADGSNICPLCFSSLSGYTSGEENNPDLTEEEPVRRNGSAYRKGSRGKRHKRSAAPTIVAVGIILILLFIIVMIVKSMFSTPATLSTATPTPKPQATMSGNFVVFGATATPGSSAVTATPNVAVTATPAPEEEQQTETGSSASAAATYKTLRKNDQGADVVLLQEALASLGYLTTASDGIYGTGTVQAVKKFQSDNGLDSDGIAGRQTQAKLFELSGVTPVPQTTPAPGDILDLPG